MGFGRHFSLHAVSGNADLYIAAYCW